MNERILELMTKAGFDVEKLRMYPGGWPREDLLVLQDFAELIVRECIDTVSDCSIEYCTRPQIVNELKEHFGVKHE